MHTRAFVLLLSGAIGLSVTGCSTSAPVMRGQSPQAAFAGWEGGHGQAPGAHAGCPMCENGGAGIPAGAIPAGGHGYGMHGAACPPGAQGHGLHGGAGPNLPFQPVHRNFHTYSTPKGLMYPPEEAPPAVYQYPYYTLRGPTDFFME